MVREIWPDVPVALGGIYPTLCPEHAAGLGADLVLPGRHMDSTSLYRCIVERGVTATGGVPTIFIDLVDHCRSNGLKLHPLRKVFLGGSSWPPDLPRDLADEQLIAFDRHRIVIIDGARLAAVAEGI